MEKKTNKAWGKVISEEFPAYKAEYRKNYLKAWRYIKKAGLQGVSATREAFKMTVSGSPTKFQQEIETHKGHTDVDELQIAHTESSFEGFIDYWKDVQINPNILKSKTVNFGNKKSVTITDAVKLMEERKITPEDFAKLVEEIKKSPYYYSYGSY